MTSFGSDRGVELKFASSGHKVDVGACDTRYPVQNIHAFLSARCTIHARDTDRDTEIFIRSHLDVRETLLKTMWGLPC